MDAYAEVKVTNKIIEIKHTLSQLLESQRETNKILKEQNQILYKLLEKEDKNANSNS